MKKIFAVLVTVVLILSFAGCGTVSAPQKNAQQQDSKKQAVEFNSTPEGAVVLLNGKEIGITPFKREIPFGMYTVNFLKENYNEVTKTPVKVDKNTKTISAKLTSQDAFGRFISEGGQTEISFDTVPNLHCAYSLQCTYSGIYFGGTYTVSGTARVDAFDIVFPSGKKIHFDVKKEDKAGHEGTFSKTITFDETGVYKIVTKKHKYYFGVDYKVTILPPTPKLKDIFPKSTCENAAAVPTGKEVAVKLLITDAKGVPIKNAPLGEYNLKTDNNGIVQFRIKIETSTFNSVATDKLYINGKYTESNALPYIYGNFCAVTYGTASFTKDGHLKSSTIPYINSDVNAVSDGDSVYIPYDAFGCSLNYWYGIDCGIKNMEIASPMKPSVIYTNEFVSRDEGMHWKQITTFQSMAAEYNHPGTLYGYSFSNAYGTAALFESDDYGAHVMPILKPNYTIKQVAADPENSDIIYLVTSKGLFKFTVKNREANECGPLNALPNCVAVNPHNSNELIASTNYGLFKTEDACKKWEKVHFPQGLESNADNIRCIAFDPENPHIVYAGGKGLFVSKDSGKNFELLKNFTIFGHSSIAVNPVNPGNIYVYDTEQGVFESNDYGKHFSKIGFPLKCPNAAITVNANGEVFLNAECIPFKLGKGVFTLPGADTILKNGPKWKIINGYFHISAGTINLENTRGIVKKDGVDIYKILDYAQ